MKLVVELLERINQQLKFRDIDDCRILKSVGRNIADGLLAKGYSETEIPSVFLDFSEFRKKSKLSISSLERDIKKLGGVDAYIEYCLVYTGNQPIYGFMNEPVYE